MSLFSKIAISLSGGGFRASAYHLGTLAYLNQLKVGDKNLLEQVKVMSTNSGGTITGLMYAQNVFSGKPFGTFYHKLYRILQGNELFEQSFSNIRTTETWNSQTKRRNLINAFAEYYHSELFEAANFDIFMNPSGHLETVIFNATEFNHGLPFRFQNNGNFGNRYFNLSNAVKSKIRLGDILAASSCFPGGFEPLKFPDDFGTQKGDEIHTFWKNHQHEPVAIMDGGIVDNQGINSIVLEEIRSKEAVTTFIVSDVQQWPGPFQFAPEKPTRWLHNWSINKVFKTISWSLFISAVLSVISFASTFVVHSLLLKFLLLLIFGIGISVLTLSIIGAIAKSKIVKFVEPILDNLVGKKQTGFWQNINFVMDLPLTLLKDLLNQRSTSFIKIVSDIFMNRISAMQIQEVLFDEKWRGRALHSNIGFLLGESSSKIKLSKDLKDVIATAGTMETTLWFKEAHIKNRMLEKLMVCGQATLNYQLTEHIDQYRTQNKKSITPSEDKQLSELYLKLHDDWVKFNENPFWAL